MLAQVDIEAACGADPSFICRQVLERTDSARWAELADVVFARPLTILLIVVVALVLSTLSHRAIGRFVGAMADGRPPARRLRHTLRDTRVANVLPPAVLDTGAVSIRSAARAETLGLVLRSVASFVIWVIAGMTILGELGINLGPLIAGAGLAGVALGFGAQSLVKDFLAGIFILVEDQYGVGDIIDAGEATGTVEAVSLRTTRLRDVSGTVWHVPNGQILRVGNMSQQWARALLDVAVTYGSNIPEAERVIKRVADEVWQDRTWAGQILEEPEVWGVEDLGPDGVTIRLVVKTQPSRQFTVMRALRARIKAALDEAGIDMPHTQRNLVLSTDASTPAKKAIPARKAAARKRAPRSRS
ncbi:MAG: mechanosensitive ion channel family protein [Acidimicrobiales bacterium]|nr:mechanosensitive ion channel family protein [Acidimicrobiales bacterium]